MNDDKYIHLTPSGKYRVCFPTGIKNPRRLGVFETKEKARQERDKFLSNVGLKVKSETEQEDTEMEAITEKDILDIDARSILFACDFHVPYEDSDALSILLQVIPDLKPDTVVLGGDLNDFYRLSRFLQDDKRSKDIQSELDECHGLLKMIKIVSGDAQIYHLLGNHESRLYSYLCANSELSSLRSLQLESLLRFDEFGIIHTKELRTLDKRLVMIHGRYTSLNSGAASRKEAKMRGFQQNVIQGHGHRFGSFEMNGPLYRLAGYEIGAMCGQSWYDDDAYWSQGFSVITISSGQFAVENVYIQNKKALFRGKLYST